TQPLLAWADLDGDGIRDAVWLDAGTGQIEVSATPVLGSVLHVDYSLAIADTDPTHYLVAVADFDQDGSDEVLLMNTVAGTTSLLRYGIRDGSLGAPPALALMPVSITTASQLRVGDFNGDGLPDVAAWDNAGGFTLTLYTGSEASDQLIYVSDEGSN